MVMFILETMVPRVDLESVSAACANFSALSLTVQKIASSVDAFDSCLRALGDTAGLEVGGGGVDLSRNARRNHIRRNDANGGKNGNVIVNIP